MVNLKPEELKKITFPIKNEADYILVQFNCARSNLPPFLQWRADQAKKCYDLNPASKAKNYHFIFALYDYKTGETTFHDSIYLRLMNVTNDGEIHTVLNNEQKDFTFYITLDDLDKYFQRYYFNDKNINTYTLSNPNGVIFNVKENLRNKTITVRNINKLLVDVPENYISATATCHFDDTYDFKTGLAIALKKWNDAWKQYFYEMSTVSESIKKVRNGIEKFKTKVAETNKTEDIEEENKQDVEKSTEENTEQNIDKNTKEKENIIMPTITLTKTDDGVTIDNNKIKNTEFVGKILGDYKVLTLHTDFNKHIKWVLQCTGCGDCRTTTRSNIKRGKFKLTCPKCNKDKKDKNKDKDKDNDKVGLVMDAVFEPSSDIYEPVPEILLGENKYVSYQEVVGDLFEAPVWSYIAHCIPSDLSFGGPIASKINEKWNMKYKLSKYSNLIIQGNCVLIDNVYNIIVNNSRYTIVTYEDIKEAVSSLAYDCWIDKVGMLSIPQLCCGANKLEWQKVREIIKDAFIGIYEDLNDCELDEEKRRIQIVVYKK